MHKAAAFKILNIYTFTLNSLHMQTIVQWSATIYICESTASVHKAACGKDAPCWATQKDKNSFKRLPLNLTEGSNILSQWGHEDFWEGLIYWMAFIKCLKTSAMLRTIFGSPKIYCREKC